MMMQVARAISFTGPIPPPEMLAKYEEACPGAADRIIKMAERQSEHRQEIEKAVVNANTSAQKIGPILGFIVAMTTVLGGIYLVLKGKNGYGLAAIITPLAALAGVFIYGKIEQRKDLSNKAADFVTPPKASSANASRELAQR